MVKDNIINPKIPWERDGPTKKEGKGESKGGAGTRASQRKNSFGVLFLIGTFLVLAKDFRLSSYFLAVCA